MNKIINIALQKSVYRILNRSVATATKVKWDLCAGVVVERLPIITRSLEPIELEYQTYLNQLELEQSLKSDHEIRHERDKLQAELLKRNDIDFDVDSAAKQTAQDMEDACTEELAKVKLASRLTDADKNNDTKSIQRKLEESLILLVEQKIGNDLVMLAPHGKRLDGETMRQTAERVLAEACGPKFSVSFYGNAPCGFYKYKYPANVRNEAVGAKIFFYRCALKSEKFEMSSKKFEWLDREEIGRKLKKPYFDSLSQFLL